MDIPFLNPIDFLHHANPSIQVARPTVDPTAPRPPMIELRYTVLVVGYAHVSGDLKTPARMNALVTNVREQLARFNRFLAENSYDTLRVRTRIRSFIAPKRRTWRGNAPAPEYVDGKLANKALFPALEKFDGYSAVEVYEDADQTTMWRSYEWVRGYANVTRDALVALEGAPFPEYDDQVSVKDWIEFGTKPEGTSALLLISDDIERGYVRVWPMGPKAHGRSFHHLAAAELVGDTIAHELSHTFGAWDDLYEMDTHAGYLGAASFMGFSAGWPHYDAFLKLRMGFIEPTTISPFRDTRTFNLAPIYRHQTNALCVRPDVLGRPGELFLIEVRDTQGERFDGAPIEFDQALGDDLQGVFVYHVDTHPGASRGRPRIDVEGEIPDVKGICVPGRLAGHGGGGFLTYDRERGRAAFYGFDGPRLRRFGRVLEGLRKTWDIIVAGRFDPTSPCDSLLFYDRMAGEAEFYSTDGFGHLVQLGETNTGWRQTWYAIVSGDFGGDRRSDLLLYDRGRGEGEVWRTTAPGTVAKLGETRTRWRTTWTSIATGNFGASSRTDVLFYDAETGEGEFYSADSIGGFARLGVTHGWDPGYDSVVALKLPDGSLTDGVCMLGPNPADTHRNRGRVLSTDGRGDTTAFGAPIEGWLRWTMAAGIELQGAGQPASLLLYDQFRGNVTVIDFDNAGNRQERPIPRIATRRDGSVLTPHETELDDHQIHTGLSIAVDKGNDDTWDVAISWVRDRGQANLVRLESDYRTRRVNHRGTWRKSWSSIVPGRFAGSTSNSIVLYDRSAGRAEFLSFDLEGNPSLLGSHDGWRKTWTLIVPGDFAGNSRTDLLLYDASAGRGEFHRVDGGNTVPLKFHDGWRKSWTHIVSGNFGAHGRTDLLFYDAQAGEAEFHATDGKGGIDRLGITNTGWRKTWTLIVPGDFGGSTGRTDLLFYDAQAGEGEFWSTDGRGRIARLGGSTKWRKTWARIVSFEGPTGKTHLLFYDRGSADLEIYECTGPAELVLRRRIEDVSETWLDIVPLHLRSNTVELLTYDP